MTLFHVVRETVALLTDLLTIAASAIAIYVFFGKRKELAAALRLLLNWSFQTTLSDLRGKLDRLNEYNANEPTDLPEIKNILNEIAGQVRGNARLHRTAPTIADRVETLASGRRLTEPNKRSIVAEMREVLRNIEVTSFEHFTGKGDE